MKSSQNHEETLLVNLNEKKREKNVDEIFKKEKVSFLNLFRYATFFDYTLMIIGSVSAIINGLCLPAFTIYFGKITEDLATNPDLLAIAFKYAIIFILIGFISFLASIIGIIFWMIAGERQSIKFRKEYYRSFLRREIAWFDMINPSELNTIYNSDVNAIQNSIGEKISNLIFNLVLCFGGVGVSFYYNWKLTLVMCAMILGLMISGSFYVYFLEQSAASRNKAYEISGGFAEQALNAIRTVVSLGGEQKEIKNYIECLYTVKKKGILYGLYIGLSLGLLSFFIINTLGVGLYYGSKLIETDGISGATVLTVILSISFGTLTIGTLGPSINAFTEGHNALCRVIPFLKKVSEINVESKIGYIPKEIKGQISFKNIFFSYPAKKNILTLKDLSIEIPAGQRIALVGESGCGKSTCMQLLERFYDVDQGSIELDSVDIRDYNIKKLRQAIGYVGQEPVLFTDTIRNNLLLAKYDASEEELVLATKKANAYDFIMDLDNKFDTMLGPNGTKLSGGQKQRIAIAKALLKQPKILLLDEATSALDRNNEIEIQETLDEVSKGITTIVIAHRLETIINADLIYVIDKGELIEKGTHNELMNKKGKYFYIQGNKNDEKKEKNNTDFIFNSSFEEGDIKVNITNLEEYRNIVNQKKKDSENNIMFTENNELEIKDDLEKNPKNEIIINENQDFNPKKKQNLKNIIFDQELKKKYTFLNIYKRLFSYNKSDFLLFIIVILFSFLSGSSFPTIGITFGELVYYLSFPESTDFREKIDFFSLMIFIISLGALISKFFQFFIQNIIGQKLTLSLRKDLYSKILNMDIGFFDDILNTPGTLSLKLSNETNAVNSLTATSLTIFIDVITCLFIGITVSFIYSWELTIMIVFTIPLIFVSSMIQEKLNIGFSAANKHIYNKSAGIISESLNNIKTIVSFTNEDRFNEIYSDNLNVVLKTIMKKSIISGIAFGFSNLVTYGIYSLVFYLGIYLMNEQRATFAEIYVASHVIIFSAFQAGSSIQYLPDISKNLNSARAIFHILDLEIKIKNNAHPIDISQESVKGSIEFKNVSFKYPTRDGNIFKNLNFLVKPGQKVAFVGSSGCGKSTIIQLLLRFYDPDEGEIMLDGINIKSYDLNSLRTKYFGAVSQEPTLFNGTIEYNIKYLKENATMEEIEKAALNANALKFILNNEFDNNNNNEKNLGSGFQRLVGPKGSQLSGGQKQRIAIARAIINNPPILLLDEATSALDSENEKIVQDALDQIMINRSSITVAHRFSTIKNSDVIFVLGKGKIVEQGKFDELLEKKNVFYHLANGKDAI